MSTKQNPGAFNCYKAALPDEPIFVVLGRDPAGPATLDKWCHERIILGKNASADDRNRLREAINQAAEMAEWRERMMEASVDGVPPWRLPMQFVTDDTKPVCILQPDEVQDARIVASGLRQDAVNLRDLVNENDDWLASLREPLLDIVDSINSRATMLQVADVSPPEFIGYNQDARSYPPLVEMVSAPEPEARYKLGDHPIMHVSEIVEKLDRLAAMDKREDPSHPGSVAHMPREPMPVAPTGDWSDAQHLNWIYERLHHVYRESENMDYMHRLHAIIGRVREAASPKQLFWASKAEMEADEDGTPVKMLSASRVCEFLDYATCYGEFDENTPNGTQSVHENISNPMNDLRRQHIFTLKQILGLIPENTPRPDSPELNEFCKRQERGETERAVGKSPALGMPYSGVANTERDSLIKMLDDALEGLRDGRLPTPHDLHRAVKNPGLGAGWNYEALPIGLGTLQRIRDLLADPYGNFAQAIAAEPVLDTMSDDLAHSPEVPAHRFAHFHKSGRYAYAKGLEVNPIHLPVALDEMEKSGWRLVTMFGATDSKHIGFVFLSVPQKVMFAPVNFPAPSPEEIREAIAETAERDRGRSLEP